MIQKESVRFYTRNYGFWWVQQVNEGRIFDPIGSCLFFAEIWHMATKKISWGDGEESYAQILSKDLIVKIG